MIPIETRKTRTEMIRELLDFAKELHETGAPWYDDLIKKVVYCVYVVAANRARYGD